MHPNTFLRTFWQPEIRPQIFVAMSFDPVYKARYENIIAPAIEAIQWQGQRLKPYRVDISKTGDSILTDIMDGVAHSVMILADVSTVGYDAKTSQPYRNANVLYEVGIALACRPPTDVLLIRDDDHKFLFDVSTIPHKRFNFNDANAKAVLTETLVDRMNQRKFEWDSRVQIAKASLLGTYATKLKELYIQQKAMTDPNQVIRLTQAGVLGEMILSHLFDKGLMVVVGLASNGETGFRLTPIGMEVGRQLSESTFDWIDVPNVAQ